MPDLLDEGFDVSVGSLPTCPIRDWCRQRLGSAFSIACASPAYIEKHGVPHVLSDLVRHT